MIGAFDLEILLIGKVEDTDETERHGDVAPLFFRVEFVETFDDFRE